MRTPHTLLILSFALFCQVASATTHFIQVGQGGGNNFAPTFVVISQGDTVQWDWVAGVHSVTSGTPGNPDGIFDSGISGTPNTFSFTFNTPANYPFYCNVHGAMMTGTVYVAVVDPPTPTVGPTATATATATPTASPTSTPPATPSPTPPPPVPTPSPTPTGTPGPNGKIAFSSNRDGNFEIYVMDPDGSHVIRLTSDQESNFEPAWSPDGTKIAFSSNRGTGNRGIYVMNPDGSGVTNLTHHPASDQEPAWSPDGTKIAFSRGLPDENVEIYVMNADGSNQTRLTDNYPVDDFAPAWSPDGTRIAFCTNRHDPGQYNYEIYVIDAGGGNEVRLTNDPGQDLWPAWSPDGTRIAFGKNGIFVMNADGSNPTRLTQFSTGAFFPEWSPDGTKIVSTGYPAGGFGEIIVIDANGANPNNLTNNPAVDEHPSWQRRPTSTPVPAQALNISTRMRVETGDNVLIGGFIVTGTAPKSVAVRGIGPSLGQFGLGDFLADPTIELRDAAGALLHQNDNWQDDPEKASQLIALGLAPKDLNESGLVATLSPGAYTAILAGTNAGAGVGLVEFYDVNPTADSHLANISTRGFVRTGDNVMIGGFILGGDNSTHVVVRGIGPSLAQFGLNPVLADPTVEVHDGNGALLVSNDNWQDNAVSASHLTAFGLAPQSAAESGIYVGLPPGAFTAILAGKDGGTGIGLVEIYNVP